MVHIIINTLNIYNSQYIIIIIKTIRFYYFILIVMWRPSL